LFPFDNVFVFAAVFAAAKVVLVSAVFWASEAALAASEAELAAELTESDVAPPAPVIEPIVILPLKKALPEVSM